MKAWEVTESGEMWPVKIVRRSVWPGSVVIERNPECCAQGETKMTAIVPISNLASAYDGRRLTTNDFPGKDSA